MEAAELQYMKENTLYVIQYFTSWSYSAPMVPALCYDINKPTGHMLCSPRRDFKRSEIYRFLSEGTVRLSLRL